ncbi:MAG: LemA family protein [Candidatus Nomurabacteria bacterium]|jgi:LemA protein|nr:LemA family protein [Candidatus Nomurabacteria bacterium]
MKINSTWVKITLIIVAAVVLLIFAINIGVRNHVVTLQENVYNAESNIKAQEKRRVDLVHNLVDSVKSYSSHELNAMLEVVEKRTENGAIDDEGGTAVNIAAVAEAYPNLKAVELYSETMLELTTTENRIFNYRETYNDAARGYNTYVAKWPANIIVGDVEKISYLNFEAPETAPQNLFD